MHDVHRTAVPNPSKKRVDPGSCGVRLGSDLRATAEQEARRCGLCLSHWIKQIVEDAIKGVAKKPVHRPTETPNTSGPPEIISGSSELDSAFRRDMEELYDR